MIPTFGPITISRKVWEVQLRVSGGALSFPFDFGSIDTRNISGLHQSLHSVGVGFVMFLCFCLFRPSDKFSYGIRHSAILMVIMALN